MIRVSKFSLTKTETNQSRFERFRQDDEGGMIIFSLFMFVLILALTGMAVDLMRFESTRAKLVGTNDRAVLAAADLDQRLSPEAVVRDYYDKANILPYLDGAVDYEPAFGTDTNYRIVTANGRATIPTFFFGLPNFLLPNEGRERQSLTATATATAEERVSDIEVSLVLDVSSSMSRNGRIEALIPAAQSFVTTVLANNLNSDQGLVTISIVPYSATVNVGAEISPLLTGLDRSHEYSTCPVFDDNMFTTTALSGTYRQLAHFNRFGSNTQIQTQALCQNHEAHGSNPADLNAIVPVSADEDLLNREIGALDPYGNTATDMGVKWGLALMDPSTQDIITNLSGVTGNSVPTEADGRPAAFPSVTDVVGTSVQKIIVIMSDGENTYQSDIEDRFKDSLSFVWFNLDDADEPLQNVNVNDISIQYAGQDTQTYADDMFYTRVGTTNQITNYPDGYSSNLEYEDAMTGEALIVRQLGKGPLYPGFVRNASWQDLLAVWHPDQINNQLMLNARNSGYLSNAGVAPSYSYVNTNTGATVSGYMPTYGDSETMEIAVSVDGDTADSRLQTICTVARTQGVIIYTVALETTTDAQNELALCANAASRSFNVVGTELAAAFDAIATNIGNLKLTQ